MPGATGIAADFPAPAPFSALLPKPNGAHRSREAAAAGL
jgi:hypothetical protein